MAERRMFAKTIVLSDDFLDMPLSARCLYFTLGMFADDDGFVNSPKGIMRQCGASEDDMKLLIAKKFLLVFDSGVIVIKHWRINNYLRNDRYVKTKYNEEMEQLTINENGSYSLGIPNVGIPSNGIPNVGIPSIGKDSIGKDSIDNNIIVSNETIRWTKKVQQVVNEWNTLEKNGIAPVKKISNNSTRYKLLIARFKDYGVDEVIKAIDNIRNSDFLCGKSDSPRRWVITFDWFIKPNNFPKVLEGQYNDRPNKTNNCDAVIDKQLEELTKQQEEQEVISDEEMERIMSERGWN